MTPSRRCTGRCQIRPDTVRGALTPIRVTACCTLKEPVMPRTSKANAPIAFDEPMIEARYVELDDYTVGFETHKADLDPGPLFAGLPDDRCQCPHWGVVVAGRMIFRYADHDEVYQAGDVYYGRPGHLPLMFAGTELIEFSPTEALNATLAVIERNLEAAKAASANSGA